MSTQCVPAQGSPYTKAFRYYSDEFNQMTKVRFAQPEDRGTAFALIEMNVSSFMLLSKEGLMGDDLQDTAEMTILAGRGLFLHGLISEELAFCISDWFDSACCVYSVYQYIMEEIAIAKLRSGPAALVYGRTDVDGQKMAMTFADWSNMPVFHKQHAMSHLLYRLRSSTDVGNPLRRAMEQLDFKLGYELSELPNHWQEVEDRKRQADADYYSDDEDEGGFSIATPFRMLWRTACWTSRVTTKGMLMGMAFHAGMQSSRWGDRR